MPASVMAKEMTTPGETQIRAMFVSAGNPVLSVPNGDELAAALEETELTVAIDLYVTDTARHADFVLPATTFLEREDFPLPFLTLHTTPFVQMTEAVVEPRGEARQEWEIIEEISKRIGVVPDASAAARRLGKFGLKLTPAPPARPAAPHRPRRRPLRPPPRRHQPEEAGEEAPRRGARRVPASRTCSPRRSASTAAGCASTRREILEELERLGAQNGHDPEFPLRLIGLRELRSHNSWMHNAALLMRGGREHTARIHPDDAAARDRGRRAVPDQLPARLDRDPGATSPTRSPAGTIAVPHGWGHRGGGWRRPTPRVGSTSTCWPPRTPRIWSGSPGWRS